MPQYVLKRYVSEDPTEQPVGVHHIDAASLTEAATMARGFLKEGDKRITLDEVSGTGGIFTIGESEIGGPDALG